MKKATRIFARIFVWTMLVLMYAPILVLMVFSFTEADTIGVWNGFSFGLYPQLFQDEELVTVVLNTILVALASAAVSTVLGTMGAIGIHYSRRRMKAALEGVSQIPVMNAEIVTALSLTVLFVYFGIQFNFITLLIGHVVLTLPFVVLSINPKLQQMDPNIYEAALDLGARPSHALRRIILPQIMPGIFSGFLLSVTLSLDDYIITAFTRDTSFSTLSTYVYGATAKGALPPTLRALTTVIFVFALVLLIVINIRSHRKKEAAR
ncbi:MAG: ABC transporter permease [Clostridia bacterium]|nr:ABC transporter permease [Clostridia bacterium]